MQPPNDSLATPSSHRFVTGEISCVLLRVDEFSVNGNLEVPWEGTIRKGIVCSAETNIKLVSRKLR